MSTRQALIKMEALGKDGCRRIHQEGLSILKNVGMRVDDPELRKVLQKNGAKTDANDRVRLPKEMVQEALKTVNRKPIFKCINGKELHVYGGNQYCGALTNDPWIIDVEKGPRPPCLEDIKRHARLADALPLVNIVTRMDYPCTDVPDKEADLRTLEALVSNTTKALFCAPSSLESAQRWVDIAEIMAGGSLHKNSILGAYVATVSPLVMSLEDSRMLRFLAGKGVIMRGGGCPLSGGTSPFTLAGTMASAEAEMIFFLTAVQAISPGAPCIYTVGGYVMDMATGIYSTADVVGLLLGIAYAEMAHFHQLPTLGTMATSNVPHYDFQNGVEAALAGFISFFGGKNVLYGLGSLANACGMSAEQVVMHHDLVEIFQRIGKGIDFTHQEEALKSIEQIGPGGNFLTDDLTIKLLRTDEHFAGKSFVIANPGPLKETMLAKAHRRVESILEAHKPAVDPEKIRQVRDYVADKLKD